MDKRISIIVPVYNEERNLPLALSDLLNAFSSYPHAYEIIVLDDGSHDNTRQVARTYEKRYSCIRSLSHTSNMGFGKTFRDGIMSAKYPWVVPFHGDNDSSAYSLREMVDRIGSADIISAYTTNSESRSLPRRIVSKMFVLCMNALFRLHLRYYTGYFVVRRDALRSLRLVSWGLPIYAEAKIRLLYQGFTIAEFPTVHTGRKHGHSKAIRLSTSIDVIRMILTLVWEFRGKIFFRHETTAYI